MLFKSEFYVSVVASTTEKLEQNISTTRPVSVDIQLALYNIFIPLLGILIIIFNLAIVVSSGLILHRGQQPRSTYIFLGNVALSDLLIGITILFGQFYPMKSRTEMVCCITIGLTVSSAISSVYSIGLIAVDRYLYILYGLQYQRYISSNRARIMSVMTWVIGLIIGFLPAMGIRNFTNNGQLCWFIILVPPNLIFITCAIGIIPLVTIIVLYSIILKHALNRISDLKLATNGTQVGALRLFRGGGSNVGHRQSIVEVNSLDEAGSQCYIAATSSIPSSNGKFLKYFRKKHSNKLQKSPSVYNPSKWKAIKIVLYTTGSFFLTWFPFFVASTLFALCDPKKTPIYCDNLRIAMASPLTILGLINSLLNPIIYAWWHNGFRESVKKIYRGIFPDRLSDSTSSATTAKTTRTSVRTGIVSSSGGSELESSDNERKSSKRSKKLKRTTQDLSQNSVEPVNRIRNDTNSEIT